MAGSSLISHAPTWSFIPWQPEVNDRGGQTGRQQQNTRHSTSIVGVEEVHHLGDVDVAAVETLHAVLIDALAHPDVGGEAPLADLVEELAHFRLGHLVT